MGDPARALQSDTSCGFKLKITEASDPLLYTCRSYLEPIFRCISLTGAHLHGEAVALCLHAVYGHVALGNIVQEVGAVT